MIRDLAEQVKYSLLIIVLMLGIVFGILSMSLNSIVWTLVGILVLGIWIESGKIVKQNKETQNGN